MSEAWREEHEQIQRALRGVRASAKGWARIQCIFCEDRLGKRDKKRSLGVKLGTGVYHCFRCGISGRLDEAPDPSLAAMDRLVEEPPELTVMDPPEGFVALASEAGETALCLEDARAYAAKRVNRALWRQLQIGACDDGKWAGRVIVPMLLGDLSGWWGWVGRLWVDGGKIPYLYPAGMPRGRLLYNHDALAAREERPLLVVEGVFDALALWPDGVAVLGKPSGDQIEALTSARRPVVWCLDGDAHEEAWALACRLRFDGQRAGYVRLPPRTDPDEVPLQWLRDEAVRSLDTPL